MGDSCGTMRPLCSGTEKRRSDNYSCAESDKESDGPSDRNSRYKMP